MGAVCRERIGGANCKSDRDPETGETERFSTEYCALESLNHARHRATAMAI